MPKPKRDHYNELFRFENQLTVLHSEFFATGSMKHGEVLIASDEKTWNSFIHKKREKDCLRMGLELFSSEKKYRQYTNSFRNYIENTAEKLISRYRVIPKDLTKKEIRKTFNELSLFWHYYGFTEFSFHDLAHRVMQKEKNEILAQNLEDLGQLKFAGREILNAYIFKKGVLHNILDALSRKFLKDNEANYLLTQEILDLFEGKKVDQDIIDKRKKYYAFKIKKGNLHEHNFEEAKEIHKNFTAIKESSVVKGTIANKGAAIGKAVIAPMLNDYVQVKKIIAKMKKGNILIAQTTSPEYMPLCKLAGAIVTDQGGMLSHAAIVSRELNIPCIVGTNVATKIFKDGDLVEVDANCGIVKKV